METELTPVARLPPTRTAIKMPLFLTLVRLSIVAFLIPSLAAGCRAGEDLPSASGEETPSYAAVSAFVKALDEHGGLDRWRTYGTLEYDVRKGDKMEHLVVDLQDRRLRLTGDVYTIGFDGKDVWVMPGLEAFSGNARFYSSLDFYFFGLPFVLADPGTVHEPLGTRTVDGREYDVVKVSFEDGIGDSPKDYYVPHFDPKTGSLELLLYTVTFTTHEPTEQFHARTYEWQEVDGLLVPLRMTSYAWDDQLQSLGEKRDEATFTNVTVRRDRPDPSLFSIPEGAEIDERPRPVGE